MELMITLQADILHEILILFLFLLLLLSTYLHVMIKGKKAPTVLLCEKITKVRSNLPKSVCEDTPLFVKFKVIRGSADRGRQFESLPLSL